MFGFLLPTGLISAIINFFTGLLPVVTKILGVFIDFVVWYFKTFWVGATAILHNLTVLAVIAPLVVASAGWMKVTESQKCKKAIELTEKKYKTILSKQSSKPTITSPLEDLVKQFWN